MKVAIFREYGPPDVLKVENQPKPTPGPTQILIQNHATAVTAADSRIRGANFPKGYSLLARLMLGLFKPSAKVQILGASFSGVVEAVGSEVTQFQVGDEVLGMKSAPNFGTYAEYVVVEETAALAHKPKNVTHQQAAGVLFGGTTALHFLRDIGKVQPKERVVIIGASGAVGTNAVQLAKYYGAHVTAVCSGKNAALVRSLGADAVIDYTKNDVSQAGLFDVVFTAAPGLTLDELASLVKPGGRVLLVLTDFWGLLQAKLPFLRKKELRKTTLLDGIALERKEDVEFLTELVAQKKLQVVIEKEYPLHKIVAAHRHADTGHKVGNIVINVA
jgi:NADPH:quinone reductase-like Zn-dependent oxidoreductase